MGVSLATLFGDNPSQMRSIPIAAKAGGFKLQQRALHVYAEAQRVRDFQQVCNNQELSQEDKLRQLGDIMDASQASCRSVLADWLHAFNHPWMCSFLQVCATPISGAAAALDQIADKLSKFRTTHACSVCMEVMSS